MTSNSSQRTRAFAVWFTAGALTMSFAPTAFAQSFAINWYTFNGGGGFSSGGDFAVTGTIGQPDAGVLTGGSFELAGGFWPGATAGVPCAGDLNADNQVDLADLAILLSNFGTPSGALPEDGDIDGDGDVDLADLAVMLSNFGTTC